MTAWRSDVTTLLLRKPVAKHSPSPFPEGVESGDHVRVIPGDVDRLSDVRLEVVERCPHGRERIRPRMPVHAGLDPDVRSGPMLEDTLPPSFPDGPQFPRVEVEEIGPGRGPLLANQQGEDVHAVDRVARNRRAGDRRHGREDVDSRRQLIAHAPRGNPTWPPHDRRHTGTTFEGSALTLPEWPGRAPVVPEIQPRSVVTREDHERVLRHPIPVERLEDLPGRPVHLLHHVAVQPLLARASERVRNAERNVRHGVGEIEEEGPVPISVDEVDGPLRVPHREPILIRQLVHRLDRFIPLDQRQRRISAQASLRHRDPVEIDGPHVVRVRQPEVLVETVLQGQKLREVAEMPLPDRRRGIAERLQELRDRDLVGVEPHLGGRRQRSEDRYTRGVAAGQE